MSLTTYGILRRSWHLLPRPVRRSLYLLLPPSIRRARNSALDRLAKGAHHDEVYDTEYYDYVVEPIMQRSATVIATAVVHEFSPRTVADLGCGTGLLLSAFRERGVATTGFENSLSAISKCSARNLNVVKFDIENDSPPEIRVDLAVSTEVAEHLPESCANKFVGTLCALSDVVVMTAATPGASGTDHVNEQPHSYWIQRFQARGYQYMKGLSERWRREWAQQGVADCFSKNVMAFRRSEA